MAHESAPRRIQQIATIVDAKSYLEIGVQGGFTFLPLRIEQKDAVDPRFVFDTSLHSNEKCRFFQMRSDEFFAGIHPRADYDLIFIDGLHTYDQTYRDFCNALSWAHEKSIIVIDDTFPVDYYSALRSQEVCEYRRKFETPTSTLREWRGDVFKILPLIKLFHTSLDYATVTGDGPAQTVVWNRRALADPAYDSPARPFASLHRLFFDLQHFSDVDYNWLLENKDILQPCGFVEFGDWLSRQWVGREEFRSG